MSAAWMVGPKGGLVRVPSDRAPPPGCVPLTHSPREVKPDPAPAFHPPPHNPAHKEAMSNTSPVPEIDLVPLTVEERKALAAIPGLVVQLTRALDAMTAGPAIIPAAAAAAIGSGNAADLVPHPLNPEAQPIPRAVAAELVAQRAAYDAAHAKPAAAPAAAPPATPTTIAEGLAAPVPTVDDLRAACGRAATRLGGNAAALARMATFGAKRVGEVPEARRALFIRYMDGDDAAKA
jgi:hypothetical protein